MVVRDLRQLCNLQPKAVSLSRRHKGPPTVPTRKTEDELGLQERRRTRTSDNIEVAMASKAASRPRRRRADEVVDMPVCQLWYADIEGT